MSRGGGGPPGMGDRGGDSPGDRLSRFEGFLRSMDANGNGVLEANEVPEERRRMIAGIAERLGLKAEGGSISISKIREAITRRSDPDREGEKKPEDEQEPLVPGFGVEQELARVPAFGERVDYVSLALSNSSSTGSSSRSSSSSDRDRDSRIRYFAQSMLKRYDQNGDGILTRDEWGRMRDAEAADANNDGKITLDELTARLAEYSRRRRGESDRGSSESGDSGRSGSNDSNGRTSYRFRTALERLLEGLPDWFPRQDVNGDGQVAMSEYSSYWDERKVREFAHHDLNGDGLITQRECLDAGTLTVELAGPAGSSAGGALGSTPGGPPGSPPGGPPGGAPEPSKDQGGSTPWWMQ